MLQTRSSLHHFCVTRHRCGCCLYVWKVKPWFHFLPEMTLAGFMCPYPDFGLPGVTIPVPGLMVTWPYGGTAVGRLEAPPVLRLMPYPPPKLFFWLVVFIENIFNAKKTSRQAEKKMQSFKLMRSVSLVTQQLSPDRRLVGIGKTSNPLRKTPSVGQGRDAA